MQEAPKAEQGGWEHLGEESDAQSRSGGAEPAPQFVPIQEARVGLGTDQILGFSALLSLSLS